MVPPRTTASSPSRTKQHHELFAYQCAGYKVFINMYLKRQKQSKRSESRVNFSLCELLFKEEWEKADCMWQMLILLPISDRHSFSSDLYRSSLPFITSNKLWRGTYFLLLLLLQNISISVITVIVNSPHSQISEVPSYWLQFQGRELEGRTEGNSKK